MRRKSEATPATIDADLDRARARFDASGDDSEYSDPPSDEEMVNRMLSGRRAAPSAPQLGVPSSGSEEGSESDDESDRKAPRTAYRPSQSDVPLGERLARLADGGRMAAGRKRHLAARRARGEDGAGSGDEEEGGSSGDERAAALGRKRTTGSAWAGDGAGGAAAEGRAPPPVKRGGPGPRSNKHAPSEVSSKRRVGVFRDVMLVAKPNHRDPRFDQLVAGGGRREAKGGEGRRLGRGGRERGPPERSDEVARRRYGFLFDETLVHETDEARRTAKKAKSENRRAEAREKAKELEGVLRAERIKRRGEELARERKRKEKELVSKGKTPYYLKASEKKALSLKAKFEELKSSGRLDRFMEKRRKKVAAKDHRGVPIGRRDASSA